MNQTRFFVCSSVLAAAAAALALTVACSKSTAEAEESYNALERTAGLIAAPKTSPLVQYLHKDATITVSPEQRSLLTQWLSLEANARNLEGAVAKPKSVTDAYKQFADCMN